MVDQREKRLLDERVKRYRQPTAKIKQEQRDVAVNRLIPFIDQTILVTVLKIFDCVDHATQEENPCRVLFSDSMENFSGQVDNSGRPGKPGKPMVLKNNNQVKFSAPSVENKYDGGAQRPQRCHSFDSNLCLDGVPTGSVSPGTWPAIHVRGIAVASEDNRGLGRDEPATTTDLTKTK